MAIALTPFTGFCGFRPLHEISRFLSTVPELANLVGLAAVQLFQESFSTDGRLALKRLFTTLMQSDPNDIATQAGLLIDRVKDTGDLSGDQSLAKLLIALDHQFPKDIGLFCAFFLNYVTLQPGEAMFLCALDMHAYISGGKSRLGEW